jgi:cardiolipin synthase
MAEPSGFDASAMRSDAPSTKTRADPPRHTARTLELAERAFSRAAGGAAIGGNSVRLLRDAKENFPAWRESLASAKDYILFECYIVDDDALGQEFADLLAQKARAGVMVRVIVDWLGCWHSLSLWAHVRAAGGRVRVFNPPRLASPLGWLSRDHRKTIVVDGRVGYVSGLCVSEKWLGDPRRRHEPWRDTGIELTGAAVDALTRAFGQVWRACGEIEAGDLPVIGERASEQGPVRLHMIANEPAVAGTFRMDLIVASIARRNLWLTDAYFIATAPYVQALRAAALDGVDVRLLVPGVSDLPALTPLSRAQYRPLLEAGVRVFEWQGTMLHAKTAVADGLWSRVGSTNLNLASWLSNYELDVAIDDPQFAALMSKQYEQDLSRSTEIVLTARNRVRRAGGPESAEVEFTTRGPTRRASTGSAGRAAAGAVSVGSALGAALTNRRALGPAEAGLLFLMSAVGFAIGVIAAIWPRVFAVPLAIIALWLAIAWFAKGVMLKRKPVVREDKGAAARQVVTETEPRPATDPVSTPQDASAQSTRSLT